MIRRLDVRVVVVGLTLLIVAAAGCGSARSNMLAGAPPTVAPKPFTYRPVEVPRHSAPAPRPPEPAPVAEPPRPPVMAGDPAWEVSVQPRPWRWIVIHHSGSDRGCAAAFDEFHRNGRHWDELGYHFVIGNGTGSGDGEVEVGSRWPKQKHGAHCRVGNNQEYNYFGIGICLVGNFERHRPTDAQMDALARLVSYLAARYHIDDSHIIGHSTVDDTRCPGRLFRFDDLFARMRNGQASRWPLASAR